MIQIDKQKVYESHGYKFKNFVCLSEEEKLMILEWRNHEKVRNMMVNKDIIPLENHLAFIESLKNREDCYYWLVTEASGANVGVIDIIHIDMDKDQGEIGYYLNQEELGKGFDFMIECLYFVYSQIKLGFNLVTVNTNNRDILLFNKYLGTTFDTIKRIGDEEFYVNERANGSYILEHYKEFSLLNYARFVKKNKNVDKLFNI